MKLVILDRDGVINHDSDNYVKSAEEWIPLPGSIEAIAELTKAGFSIVVATNQSGLGRGLFSLDDLEAMHEKMVSLVESAGGEISAVFYCPHTPDDNCHCRKPKAGMLDAIEAEFDTHLNNIVIVGDSYRDLEAGLEKGCQPILVRTGKGATTEQKITCGDLQTIDNLIVVDDLLHSLPYILNHTA